MRVDFKNSLRSTTVLAAMLAAGVATPAFAQEQGAIVAPTLRVGADADAYKAATTSSATKTETPLVNVPQSVTVVTEAQMQDQAVQNLADVVRYTPGVGFAQGEGNRDAPIFRGNATTADMFVDGMRDDLQYYRDLYNVERVDVLRGPNGMIFGRGGAGGVINRITKQADGETVRQLGLQASSEGGGRVTADIGQALNDVASFRVTGLVEDSDSYRDDVSYERVGLNPTLGFRIGENTTLRAGYEYYDYEFVADRGVTTLNGRPVDVDPKTFMGDPARSPTTATINAFTASIEHAFGNGAKLSNRFRYADQDKFYQNVFPGAANAAGTTVSISAYNNLSARESTFNQTDLTFSVGTGPIKHNILVGMELGKQTSDSRRDDGIFTGAGCTAATATTANACTVPLSDPRTPASAYGLVFRHLPSQGFSTSEADQVALYAQDQIELSPQWQLVAGVRYDNFKVDHLNRNTNATFKSEDDLWSPRVGVIFKPIESMSAYASYTQTFVPRAGEQLGSLSATNATFDPEEWENIEAGFKWDITEALSASAAVYQLDRTNQLIADPLAGAPGGPPAGTQILVEGQRVTGVELAFTGDVTEAWSVVGSYAYQDGETLSNQSATIRKGAQLGQVPEHSFALWNRYDFTPNWGAGLGVIYAADRYATTQNIATPASNVTLEAYTRIDGAVYWTINDNFRVQANIENLLDEEYYPNAHSNTNVMPGSPRSFRVGLTTNF
jgi:catecholate siderophore receptor